MTGNNKMHDIININKVVIMRISILLFIFFCQTILALDNQHIFPLDNYTQNIDYWLSPINPDYTKPLLSPQYQNERLSKLKHRYFGTNETDPSPWAARHITSLLQES